MEEDKLRHRISLMLIIMNSLLLVVLFILRAIDWLDDDEFKTSLPIVIPTFASFVTVAYKFVAANPFQNPENTNAVTVQRYNKTFVYMANYSPIAFFFAFLLVVLIQSARHYETGQYAVYLGIVETGFAVYLGYIVKTLYKS